DYYCYSTDVSNNHLF
nr:immunoglobulin light chain junction region [Macaca mulatta]MOW27911.1 immunoglobulin light chain junction region [Macaca mulatta]MOW28067.1 immunoglobulin light chain junction region [Macaca mulatta]